MKTRILSGLQVTGRAHIGNYFGAMKQFVDLQNSGAEEIFVFVANLHSLSTNLFGEELKQNTIDLVKDYLAIGLDPKKVNLFLQSDIYEHSELNWIFNSLITVPFMERAHAYKDKVANGKEATVALFTYPILMAADILLYTPSPNENIKLLVPVGQDQKQHIEYARDIAGKFNNIYGEIFKLPEDYIIKETGIVPGIDGRKMSKSYGNHIPLFASDEEIRKICMSIVTDSAGLNDKKNANENNIFNIYKLFANEAETTKMKSDLENGGVGYSQMKKDLAEKIIEFVSPMRERREKITEAEVFEVLKKGAENARKMASKKMELVREKTGIVKN